MCFDMTITIEAVLCSMKTQTGPGYNRTEPTGLDRTGPDQTYYEGPFCSVRSFMHVTRVVLHVKSCI